MDPTVNTIVKCKNSDCNKTYNINRIQWHLSNKPECKSKYTAESLAELENICKKYRKKALGRTMKEKKPKRKCLCK